MFANPWALLLLLLTAPIVWLYRRRAAMPETPVAAGALWEQVFAEEPFRAWWLPRRHAASLAVQLAILAAAVLALAQPRLSPPQTTILILDHSAGMNAADVEPSRFEATRQHARRRIDALPAGDKLGILAGGTPVSVVCPPTADRRLLHESLDALAPGMGKARVPEAVELARRMLSGRAAGRIAVLTDACFAEAPEVAEADRVELFTVGGQAANVAVGRVAARREPGRPEAAQVLVEVWGYPPVDPADVPLELRRDGELLAAPPAELDTGSHAATVYEWPSAQPGVLAVHARYDDVLPADNRRSAAVPPAEVLDVVLVGRVNPFVAAALEANPMVRVAYADTSPREDADHAPQGVMPTVRIPKTVCVLQGKVPPRLPAGPVLVLGPRNATDLWEVDGVIEHAPVAQQAIESDILAGLDLEGIVFSDVARLKLRSLAPDAAMVPAATAEGEPLLLALERPEGRVVVIGGDPGTSELVHQAEFPSLLAQAIRWLGGPAGEEAKASLGAQPPGAWVNPAAETAGTTHPTPPAFPIGESDLRVPADLGTPADRWQPPQRWPAAWLVLGALALALLVSEWCLYQRRWIS